MQPCLTETQRTLATLLEAIEAETAKTMPRSEDQRSEERHPLHAECELCMFSEVGEPMIVEDAVARNLTFLGLSVVVSAREPVRPGRPVEAVVVVPPHTRTHIAGTVAFCREVEDGCCEIGIAVQAAGATPILMHDVATAWSTYEWFAEALKVPVKDIPAD